MEPKRRRRTEAILGLAQLGVGIVLAGALGDWWLGRYAPLVAAVALTFVVHALSWRVRGRIRGLWITVFGVCGFLSKIDPDLSTRAMGDLRIPVIVGGSILALAYGFLVEETEPLRRLIGRAR